MKSSAIKNQEKQNARSLLLPSEASKATRLKIASEEMQTQWELFKSTLLSTYLPADQSVLTNLLNKGLDVCDISSENIQGKEYIIKKGANRIVSHYFLSQTIQKASLSKIALAPKQFILVPTHEASEKFTSTCEKISKASLEFTTTQLKDEAVWQILFLRWFQVYAGNKFPSTFKQEAEREDVELYVIAKKVAFDPIGKNFKREHWIDLCHLVLTTPFDLGALGSWNFGLNAQNQIIIFDTEYGAFSDGREGMYNFAVHNNWVFGQEEVVDQGNSDINYWRSQLKKD